MHNEVTFFRNQLLDCSLSVCRMTHVFGRLFFAECFVSDPRTAVLCIDVHVLYLFYLSIMERKPIRFRCCFSMFMPVTLRIEDGVLGRFRMNRPRLGGIAEMILHVAFSAPSHQREESAAVLALDWGSRLANGSNEDLDNLPISTSASPCKHISWLWRSWPVLRRARGLAFLWPPSAADCNSPTPLRKPRQSKILAIKLQIKWPTRVRLQ